MGYVDKTLTGDEKIVYNAKVDWFTFIIPVFTLILGIIVYIYRIPFKEFNSIEEVGVLIAAIVTHSLFVMLIFKGLLSLIRAFLHKISTELILTTKRVVFKTGFIRRKTVELTHKQIESLSFRQSVMGRIFNFGDIIIYGTGGVSTPIYDIDNPLLFRNKATELIDENQR